MDQKTSSEAFEHIREARDIAAPSRFKRVVRGTLLIGLLLAILAIGYRLGKTDLIIPGWVPARVVELLGSAEPSLTKPDGPILYYRDPDGRPAYAAEPRKLPDGRDYVAVRAGEDVSFQDAPAPLASEAQAGETKRVLYYRNPMGLPDTSPTPKKDSMGMDYLPVFEGEQEDGNTVKVSPGKLQRSSVRSEPVVRRVLSLPVRAPGSIQLDERRVAVVSLRAQSFIEKVEAVTTGERVRKGQPLMRIYSPEIAAAAAQYLSVVSQPSGSGPSGAEGARRRLENLDVPAEVMAEIERTRKVPLTISWPAPRDGILLERAAIDGMRAMPGDVMFRIADVSIVWALIDVAERELPMMRVGESVAVRSRGDAERVFTGKINLIYPQINKETRTARVRIELANPDSILLPDMYVEAEIATGTGNPVVAVPNSAVIDSGNRQVVIIDKGDGRFEPRAVKLGRRGEGFVEIREGVAEGDVVVTSANFLIDAESNLKAALRGLTPSEPPQ